MVSDEMAESSSEAMRASLVAQAVEAAGSRFRRIVASREASSKPPERTDLTLDRSGVDRLGSRMTLSRNLVAREPKYLLPPLIPVENKHCHGNPDACEAFASTDGGLDIFQAIVHGGADVWGFAGAGSWYTAEDPGRTELVELRGIISWTYDYKLQSGGTDTAHSGGEFGVKVHSWDSQGQDYQEENTHVGLWAYGVDPADWRHGFSDASGPVNVNHTFQYVQGRSYLCVGYIWGYSDANGGIGSQAKTEITGGSPWLVTQDWVRP